VTERPIAENSVGVEIDAGIATVTIRRGKVNALNGDVIDGLARTFAALRSDPDVRAVVLTGAGKFFSFGFDIPELFPLSPADFTSYLDRFTGFYRELFLHPKPVVAALNGHAIAGGCMLALAADRRIMAEGKGKISLNEIGFGSSLFAGSVEMLRFQVGSAAASRIALSGAMFTAPEAVELGLVDEVAPAEAVVDAARRAAERLAGTDPAAFASIKRLLRAPVAEEMERREPASIREFVEIWYSPSTRANLEKITIGS
jgi:enoyl-CoA hydratase/carnithine racemase